ncbi:MBL fold metallo-hydrolase [Zhouia amylolytica]|uniref:Metallo-beta-lactamase domain-containing protein n=1 Tax=Zhouia amylolytica AD3 TaxID=1286632 RepID=W2URM1_9FLAO|nr:MBL fold metallo-hydrolase [Zhouia amylolytica]ETN96790.1 hypothetical protein P278_02160 [Zhouia amylolytica AD3]
MRLSILFLCLMHLFFAQGQRTTNPNSDVSLIVLGTIQDAGSPQIGCTKSCCKELFNRPDEKRKVVSLGIIDPANRKTYLFEATPDIATQLKLLNDHAPFKTDQTPDGVFITHAHIGHYTGLMYLGKEAMNANLVPVYTLPKMHSFLEGNGPWSQLVSNQNINLQTLTDHKSLKISSNITVTPFKVPHRDEYSETAGFRIKGPGKSVLFIPDIDKWHKWNLNLIEELSKVDYAFIDATFYNAEEINNRDISEIPHPFIIESMDLLKSLPKEEKEKVFFIHFNHTNPVLNTGNPQVDLINSKGFNIARFGDIFKL